MTSEQLSTELTVTPTESGMRLDAFLAQRLPTRSRVLLRRAISAGTVAVDGQPTKPAYRLVPGQRVQVTLDPPPSSTPTPEAMALDILFEDSDLVAINKPPGLVVHPSKGHGGGTLVNALAAHFEQLSSVGGSTRPGIVHRLDRDTSGILIVAKTDPAHLALARQWERRTIEKEYVALVTGAPDRDRDLIDQPIGVHPYQREKMAIRARHGASREATTFYTVLERFAGFAALSVQPHTGRTHQIRVHLAHIGCPVLCDRLYGGRSKITLGELQHTADPTVVLDRQALHARRLQFAHPRTGQTLELEAALPADLQHALDMLRQWRRRV